MPFGLISCGNGEWPGVFSRAGFPSELRLEFATALGFMGCPLIIASISPLSRVSIPEEPPPGGPGFPCSPQRFPRSRISFFHYPFHLVVDPDGGVFAVVAVLGNLPARKICSSFFPKVSGPIAGLIPHSVTILRARSVATSMSLAAPVVSWSRNIFSAQRPPIRIAICPSTNSFV